jgi:hypothetical protein
MASNSNDWIFHYSITPLLHYSRKKETYKNDRNWVCGDLFTDSKGFDVGNNPPAILDCDGCV